MKERVAKKTKEQEKRKKQENRFSFEQEIVIGVTKKQEPKKENTKTNHKKKKRNKKVTKNSQKKTNQKARKPKKSIPKKELSEEEIEKIAKKRKRRIFILKCIALCILLITLILCAMFSPLFNIKTIQVRGNQKITENEIISLSQIAIEQNTFQLNKRKIKRQIKQNAYIEDVKIIRTLPSTIIIQVEEREPAYLLEYAGGYIYLDKQGYILEITQEKLELPILQEAATPTTEFQVRKSSAIRRFRNIPYFIKNYGIMQNRRNRNAYYKN